MRSNSFSQSWVTAASSASCSGMIPVGQAGPNSSAIILRYSKAFDRRTTHLKVVFAEEQHHRDARPAANCQGLAQIEIGVAIEIANLNPRRGDLEMGEDRALVDAIATPGSRQAQHLHIPLERRKQIALCLRQGDFLVDHLPATALLVGPYLARKSWYW